MATSPATLLSSRRIGPETSSERSKLPETDGPIWQPASATTMVSNAMGAASLLSRVILPPAPTAALSSPSLVEDTQSPAKMFRLPSGPERALPPKALVQGTLPVAFEIERDIGKACCFEPGRDGSSHLCRQSARHFVRGYFYARKLIVQADAKLPKA